MSPEQCNEQGYNEKSDIWSLGIIIFEMANLAPPFQANNHLALALKIKDGKYKRIPEQYSEELMRVIRWMLKPEQQDRPNVEDLLNLPNVSIRLRERALKRNIEHMKKRQTEIEDMEADIQKQELVIAKREEDLDQKERKIEEIEKLIAELQEDIRCGKNSGVAASTVAGTDYLCGNSGESAHDYNNEDGVNIGSTDECEDIISNLRDKSQSGEQPGVRQSKNSLLLSSDSAQMQLMVPSSQRKQIMGSESNPAMNLSMRSASNDKGINEYSIGMPSVTESYATDLLKFARSSSGLKGNSFLQNSQNLS